jgi:hypothetical protein
MDDSRGTARDPLPLPSLLGSPVRGLTKVHRRGAQKLQRTAAVERAAGEMVWSVNELFGRGQGSSKVRPSLAQRLAIEHFVDVASRDVPPSPPMAPEAALQELLGHKASSYVEEEVSSTAPFSSGGHLLA